MKIVYLLCGLLLLSSGRAYSEPTMLESLIKQSENCSKPTDTAQILNCRIICVDMAVLGRKAPEKLAEGLKTDKRDRIALILMAFQYIGVPDTVKLLKDVGTYCRKSKDAELLSLYYTVLSGIYSSDSVAYLGEPVSPKMENAKMLDMARKIGMAEQGIIQNADLAAAAKAKTPEAYVYEAYAYANMGNEQALGEVFTVAPDHTFSDRDRTNIRHGLEFALWLKEKESREKRAGDSAITNGTDKPSANARKTPEEIGKLKLQYVYELAEKTRDSEEWYWAFGYLSSHPLNPEYSKLIHQLSEDAATGDHRQQADNFMQFFDERTKALDEEPN